MVATLRVDLNRDGPKSVEVPASLSVEGDFYISVENHGTDAHVHLHLDEALSRVARIEQTNPFVPGGGETRIPVSVEPGAEASGMLEVVTGHGATRQAVQLTLETPTESTVQVDEGLAEPPSPDRRESDRSDDGSAVPLGVLGVIAVVVAVAVAATSEVGAVIVGIVALVAGLGAAAYFLTQS